MAMMNRNKEAKEQEKAEQGGEEEERINSGRNRIVCQRRNVALLR